MHTKGPWVVVGQPTRISLAVGNKELDEVTAIPRGKNKEANAKLIAAAPDLLQACQALVDAVGNSPEFTVDEADALARCAIAKATT